MKTHYRIHRWLAIPLGVFLFVQAFTGVLYVLPLPAVPRGGPAPTVAWDAVRVSPAEVAGESQVRAATLYGVGEVPVYELILRDAEPRYVDARDGSTFRVDADRAREIALAHVGTDAAIAEVRKLDEYEFFHPGGPLPVFHVAFADGVEVYVEGPSGRVKSAWNLSEKVRNVLVRIHDFEIVHRVLRSSRVTNLLLISLSGLSCLAVFTGYNILWQQRRTRLRTERLRAERGSESGAPPVPPRDDRRA